MPSTFLQYGSKMQRVCAYFMIGFYKKIFTPSIFSAFEGREGRNCTGNARFPSCPPTKEDREGSFKLWKRRGRAFAGRNVENDGGYDCSLSLLAFCSAFFFSFCRFVTLFIDGTDSPAYGKIFLFKLPLLLPFIDWEYVLSLPYRTKHYNSRRLSCFYIELAFHTYM